MPEQAPSNPFGMWSDFLQRNIDSWAQAASAAAPAAAPPSAANVFEVWSKLFQQGTEAWAKASVNGAPPQPVDVTRQFFSIWQDAWMKTLSQAPSSDFFKAGEKIWMEQLDSLAQTFNKSMGSQEFATFLAKSLEQQLLWQTRAAEATNPHFDASLKSMNLPSRDQIDRLFERVIGLEERLDEIESETHKIAKHLEDPAPKPPASTPRPRRVTPLRRSK